jgi:long-chain fatty acid transport protein
MLFIRVGGYYDISPVLDGYLSPELPDMTQFVPTAGVGVLIKEKVGLDLSWMHQDHMRQADLTAEGWSANYHRIADIFSFSASFNF